MGVGGSCPVCVVTSVQLYELFCISMCFPTLCSFSTEHQVVIVFARKKGFGFSVNFVGK